MEAIFNTQSELADDFKLKAILSLQELENHDMIYVYHHLKVGDPLRLTPAGTNLKGDLRMKVEFRNFVLGIVHLSGVLREFYEGQAELWAEISSMEKKKYLPIQKLDIALQALKLKRVS